MPIESDDDRRAFLADDGVLADWTVGATTHEDILVLFDNGTIDQSLQDSVAVQNRRATISLLESDLPAEAGDAADEIVVGAVTYHPKELMPDGQGFVIVHLEEA